jgi:hypothetical protein
MQTQKGTSKTDNPETYQTAVRKNIYVNKMKEQTPYTHIHDRLLSWLCTSISIKGDIAKLALNAQTSPLNEMI